MSIAGYDFICTFDMTIRMKSAARYFASPENRKFSKAEAKVQGYPSGSVGPRTDGGGIVFAMVPYVTDVGFLCLYSGWVLIGLQVSMSYKSPRFFL